MSDKRRRATSPRSGQPNSTGGFRTVAEARQALRSALRDLGPDNADNPVAAVRAMAEVGRRCRLPSAAAWEAFRWAAELEIRPYFERRGVPPAKAVTWAVLDPYFGKAKGPDPEPSLSSHTLSAQAPRRIVVTVAETAR